MIRNLIGMLRLCRPWQRYYLAGALAMLVVDGLDTFTPQLVRWSIDHLVYMTAPAAQAGPDSPLGRILPASWFGSTAFMGGMWVYGLLYLLIVAVMGVFRYRMSIGFARGAVYLTDNLRRRFFAHVQRLPAAYHDRKKSGDLMTLATSDLTALREFYWIGLLIALDTAYYFVLVPFYMADISLKLLLACLATLPLIPVIVARLSTRMERRYDEAQAQLSVLSERTRESFAGIRVIQSFAREDHETATFSRLAREYCGRALRLAKLEALEQPLLVYMLALADLVVVAYGGWLVLDGFSLQRTLAAQGASTAEIDAAVQAAGAVTVGGFVAFFSYLIRLSGPMVGFGWVVSLYLRARVSKERIDAVMRTEPTAVAPATGPLPETIRGEIEFRKLTFRYSGLDAAESTPAATGAKMPALTDISFRVAPGQTIALVGPVGSGKSTLLNLVPRLYDPAPGTVLIDGHDVRTLPADRLRRWIGTVSQETFLFSETILQNLALGLADPDVPPSREEGWLRHCARLAQVEEDILGFPKQYDTLLGEKGVNLSGGQKQRLAIARALARRPSILLLDDCLSAVDTHTESRVLTGLREALHNCTVLIASHRLSTVEHADEILVLEAGRIRERGTHAALLRAGGFYAELWEKQQLEQELESAGPADNAVRVAEPEGGDES